MSETQKQELETYRATVQRQETELVEVRQQLAKLSEIVDRQTDDMKQLNAEARLAVASPGFGTRGHETKSVIFTG